MITLAKFKKNFKSQKLKGREVGFASCAKSLLIIFVKTLVLKFAALNAKTTISRF